MQLTRRAFEKARAGFQIPHVFRRRQFEIVERRYPAAFRIGRRDHVDPDWLGILQVVERVNLKLVKAAIVQDEYV